MKSSLLLALWCLVPVAVLAYHFGPGQRQLQRDHTGGHLGAARAAEHAENWAAAVAAYSAALSALPKEEVESRWQIQLARAKARIFTGELPEAMIEMEGLLGDVLKAGARPALVNEIRAEAASAQYYLAWLMRLEGATAEEWTPELDQARQHFRLLTEQHQPQGQAADHAASSAIANPAYDKNLEAVIRLARMDLTELQGLPLPKQCQGCKNASQKCRSQRESQCKEGQQPKEREDARNAGAGKRPDGTGS